MFDDSLRFRSQARYSLTSVGTITLSIQLLTSGLMAAGPSFDAVAMA